jgi:DNA-binding transcriptional LysR family regulator
MELRQVEHFRAVVEHGSFTAAARSARIVQSALSTSIRKLERELGAPLFERTTRRVALSEAGRAFLPHARRVLAEAEAATDAVGAVAGLRRGRVAIGTIQWLGPVDLPAELSAFHRHHPGIHLTVLNVPVDALVDRLRNGELDLAYLASDRALPDGLAGRTVYRERLRLIMPLGHPLATRRQVRWAELHDESLVLFAEGSAVTAIVRRVCTQLGVRQRVVGQVTQVDLQLALVRHGLGVAVVQGTLAGSTDGVAVADLVDPDIRWAVSLAARAPGPVNPAAVVLRDHLTAATHPVA